ncbi:hypothetical protein FRC08_005269 [Ceratobasidium sp. 394]|nr:hypothetical protein FRC08_005269 [Ceratobasidium sp. 394]
MSEHDSHENVTTIDPKYGSHNTSVKAILDVCQHDTSWLSQDGPAYEFLDLVSSFSPGFTELDVMAAARTAHVVPMARIYEGQSDQPPRFTAVALDIGLYTFHPDDLERLEAALKTPRIYRVCVEDMRQPESWAEEATILDQHDILEYLVAQKIDRTSYTPKSLITGTEWRRYSFDLTIDASRCLRFMPATNFVKKLPRLNGIQ